MRSTVLLVVAACSSPTASIEVDATVASPDATESAADAPAATGFGELSGMCGVLMAMDMTSPSPMLVRDTFTFERQYVDPTDRPLLTEGGRRLAETPNAGGSSGLSEVFAFEQLARCELATLLKTETEIVYDQAGKITDLEVTLDGHKIGVSVTRAVAYPFGSTYTMDAAAMLLTRKLGDIQLSTANVSAQDRWSKQVLAILAWDATVATTVAQAWNGLDASVKADTIVVLTLTDGQDLFIYSNM
ncbi:MAG TPA: hypothetical protein VIV11_32085 [Kofleriaceae bacterium]